MKNNLLASNISRYRRESGLTQEMLANSLGVTSQAVSKWETGQTMPDAALLPELARNMKISLDKLFGYASYEADSYYEENYRGEEYYWGVRPSAMCLKILELMPPEKPLKLIDIGCGEGKDAVFFARCGYDVSAYDISEAGIRKLKMLAETARVRINAFKADIWDYRLEEKYDIIYSSGALHYMKPEHRSEIIGDYRSNTNENGLNAFHVFVEKPYIAPPPEKEKNWNPWLSGQIFTCYHDWLIESCREYVFDCDSSGVRHRHAANVIYARKTV